MGHIIGFNELNVSFPMVCYNIELIRGRRDTKCKYMCVSILYELLLSMSYIAFEIVGIIRHNS